MCGVGWGREGRGLANEEQKYTAGLTGKTERALAEKAGHLEMLDGGKERKKEGGRGKGGGGGGGGERGKGRGKGEGGK